MSNRKRVPIVFEDPDREAWSVEKISRSTSTMCNVQVINLTIREAEIVLHDEPQLYGVATDCVSQLNTSGTKVAQSCNLCSDIEAWQPDTLHMSYKRPHGLLTAYIRPDSHPDNQPKFEEEHPRIRCSKLRFEQGYIIFKWLTELAYRFAFGGTI